MKKLLQISFLLVFTFASLTTFAQKKISNGKVQFEITELEGDSPQLAMLKGTLINMAFLGGQQKMDLAVMGGLMRVQTIMDAKDPENPTILMDMMGQKIHITDAGEEFADKMGAGMMTQGEGETPNFKITYDKKDKKTIAGYKCIKANVQGDDGPPIEMYVTKKINPENSQFQEMFKDLDGFPMEIMIKAQGIGITIAAKEVKDNIDAANFAVPDGYTKMTMQEFSEQMGGMMEFGG